MHRILLTVAVVLWTAATAPAATLLENAATASGPRDVVCEAVEVVLADDLGNPTAVMHAYTYSVDDDGERPITFLWNGGPGASAALLHTSFAGPVTAAPGDGRAELTPNPLTLVDLTDLVFVDPIGTGHSRAIDDDDNARFWGVKEDAEAAARFVGTYLDHSGSLSRPVYLCGESYGGVRVAAMLEPLRERDIEPVGLILISPALESRLLSPKRRSRSARVVRADTLPTLAAIALASGTRFAENERDFIEEACAFAHGPYLNALSAADRPSDETIEDLKAQRMRFTDRPETAGRDRYDARFPLEQDAMNGIEVDDLGAALRELLVQAHGIDTDGRYMLLNHEANRRWRAPDGRRGIAHSDIRAPDMIAQAAENGGAPRVFIAGGWYDLVTPFAIAHRLASEGAFGECDVTVTDYPAGHVIYADREAHRALVDDLRDWWRGE